MDKQRWFELFKWLSTASRVEIEIAISNLQRDFESGITAVNQKIFSKKLITVLTDELKARLEAEQKN